MADYYAVLGVSRDADLRSITKAYRKKAKKIHPDKVADPAASIKATEAFKQLVGAYDVLRDPAKKRSYDRQLAKMEQKQQKHKAHKRPAPQPKKQYREAFKGQIELEWGNKPCLISGYVNTKNNHDRVIRLRMDKALVNDRFHFFFNSKGVVLHQSKRYKDMIDIDIVSNFSGNLIFFIGEFNRPATMRALPLLNQLAKFMPQDSLSQPIMNTLKKVQEQKDEICKKYAAVEAKIDQYLEQNHGSACKQDALRMLKDSIHHKNGSMHAYELARRQLSKQGKLGGAMRGFFSHRVRDMFEEVQQINQDHQGAIKRTLPR